PNADPADHSAGEERRPGPASNQAADPGVEGYPGSEAAEGSAGLVVGAAKGVGPGQRTNPTGRADGAGTGDRDAGRVEAEPVVVASPGGPPVDGCTHRRAAWGDGNRFRPRKEFHGWPRAACLLSPSPSRPRWSSGASACRPPSRPASPRPLPRPGM